MVCGRLRACRPFTHAEIHHVEHLESQRAPSRVAVDRVRRQIRVWELPVIAHDELSLHRPEAGSPAARIAVEVFIVHMQHNRVRPYDIATRCRTRAVTRHVPTGPRREVLRSFELAPPFWPVTVDRNAAALTGYGIDRAGGCIRYLRNPYPLMNCVDDVMIQRVQFSPGCHEVMRRATRTNPAFVCDPLPYSQATEVLSEYLIDAAVSLSEGRGPVVLPAPAEPHIPH